MILVLEPFLLVLRRALWIPGASFRDVCIYPQVRAVFAASIFLPMDFHHVDISSRIVMRAISTYRRFIHAVHEHDSGFDVGL